MSAVELKKGVYWVGVKNPELRVFDIIMTTKKGTTYNSYLIVDEKITLIDTVKDGYQDEFLKNIKSLIGDRKIDYLVVHHTEPDHSGSLRKILETYEDIVVYASKPALINIREITNMNFNGVEAKEELNIGDRTLKFISAPFLHWPDTIFTYSEKDKILFTCDAFGCHYCDENSIFNDEVGDFSDEFRYYYDVIMGPFKKYVVSAIEKIKNIDFDMVCTSHGPVLRRDVNKYIDLYEKWSREGIYEEEKSAVVAYVSAYGYTKQIAEAITNGLKENGVNVYLYDISESNLSEIVDKIERSKALLVGSPTINQDAVKPVWDLLSLICPINNRGKIATAFGSYGWSGEAVPMLIDRLKGLKFNTEIEGLKVKFKPSEDDLIKAKELGNMIANRI
ncbi:FprA family A-type flavoprotein [Thermobrachium celere]|uniref:Probable flavoprotein n=1 Tax=Thermobrachium celere DSM 8682 TaxID=941824 RepID=R7RQR7_9CLOT|nr:FprA family A-type flavoprotein [Thermobrachium celere]CDF58522.1 Probable flavoprotein [Thermobrachium celere DSM 8682]